MPHGSPVSAAPGGDKLRPSTGDASKSAASTRLEVQGLSGTTRRVDPHFVGYNSDYYYVNSPWSDSRRRQAAVSARPTMLRYPGGTSANYWDADHSRLFRDVEKIEPGDGDPAAWTQTRYTINWIHGAYFWTNVTPLSDYKNLWEALGRSAVGSPGTILVANLVTPGSDFYALRWKRTVDNNPGSADWWAMMTDRYVRLERMLADAKRAGVPVHYVELGNEYYFGAGMTHPGGKPADVEPYVAGGYASDRNNAYENVGAFPGKDGSGKDALYLYSVVASLWATKLKASHPGVKVCAVGAFVDKPDSGARTALWNRSALSALGPAKVDAVSLHQYGGSVAGSHVGAEPAFGTAVRGWRDHWRAGMARSHYPPDRDIWITEFNIGDEFGNSGGKLPDDRGTWGNGLANLVCVHYWLEHEPRVQIVLLHELARVIEGDGPRIKANARAYGLFASASAGATQARPVRLAGLPALAGTGGALPGVCGWAFVRAEDGGRKGADQATRYVFVNWTDRTYALERVDRLPGASGATFRQAAAARAARADPGETVGRVAGRSLSLPPRSVTVLAAGDRANVPSPSPRLR